MRWLRPFFQSRDPIVKVAAGLSEPEAKMLRELLENNGAPPMLKNMNPHTVMYQWGASSPNDYDLFVKRSDLTRARAILGPMLEPQHLAMEEEA
jgi:hypothetical protein